MIGGTEPTGSRSVKMKHFRSLCRSKLASMDLCIPQQEKKTTISKKTKQHTIIKIIIKTLNKRSSKFLMLNCFLYTQVYFSFVNKLSVQKQLCMKSNYVGFFLRNLGKHTIIPSLTKPIGGMNIIQTLENFNS